MTFNPPRPGDIDSMSLTRNALLRASKSQWLQHQVTNRSFTRRAVRKFMPGEQVDDALAAAEVLAAQKLGTVFTQLGEDLTSLAEADAVRDHYLTVFDKIKARGIAGHVSVKPTQLGLNLSPQACARHLDTLAAKSAATGIFFWIDMEDSTYVDRTLDLYRGLRAKHDLVGLALQSYLRRTPRDLESLLPLKPRIRLVKGAYMEPAEIAYPAKRDVDNAYFDLGDEMLAHAAKGDLWPIFGTHDLDVLQRLANRAAERGVKDGAYEIHMLYGIRSTEQRELVASGRVVKTLISYGSAWFRWYLRRLAERPANIWFVMKSVLPG
jgi:proline dehydrogenase